MKIFSHRSALPVRQWLALCAWSLVLSSGPALAQTAYTITEVGGAQCAASGIGDGGQVVGQCNNVAAVLSNGIGTSLGKLPNGTYSLAESINAQGIAVGNGDTGDRRPKALLFRGGKVINIDPSAANAYGIFINDNGVIVGNALKGFGTGLATIATEQNPNGLDAVVAAEKRHRDQQAEAAGSTGTPDAGASS